MNTKQSITRIASKAIALLALFAVSQTAAVANNQESVIDDFSDPQVNSLGVDRLFLDDTTAGGQTVVSNTVKDGLLTIKGEIVPARGQLGWASAALLLDAQGAPQDVSEYEGIRLVIRIKEGNLSVSANSADVKNYDYHAALVTRHGDGEFHEVKIPFSSMKRAWSEQTPLNTETIQSISLVAFGMQPCSFAFEVDEVSFY